MKHISADRNHRHLVRLVSLLSAFLLFVILPGMQVSAAQTYTITVKAKYGQTEARTILDMVNGLRTSSTDAWYWNSDNASKTVFNNGGTSLSRLSYDYSLEATAMQRAAEIAVSFDHSRPDGSTCYTAYSSVFSNSSRGENIAIGYQNASSVFVGWCEENDNYSGQGHRRNMLSANYQSIGIGYAEVNGVKCWVQEFSGKSSGASATAANDSLTPVDIAIDSASLKNVNITPNMTLCGTRPNEYAALPTLSISIQMNSTFRGPVPVTIPYSWTIADSTVAMLENNQLLGLKAGTTTLSTTVLGQTVTVPVSVTQETEHHYDDGVITTEPTCQKPGVKTFTCTGCGDTYTESVPAKGHNFPSEVNITFTEPTCTTDGEGGRVCLNGCGYYYPVVLKAGHDLSISSQTPATCTLDGSKTGSCKKCGLKITETIPATGHSWSTTSRKEPDCINAGKTVKTCQACGMTTTETLPALGHEWKVTKQVDASCKKDGSKTSTCSECGAVKTETIKAGGHRLIDFGYYKICLDCDEIFEGNVVADRDETGSSDDSDSSHGSDGSSGKDASSDSSSQGTNAQKVLKKGARFTNAKKMAAFKVTSSSPESPTVEYVSPTAKGKKKSSLKIPASITKNGVKYKVTSIGAKAFYNNNKLKSIQIPSGVTVLKTSCFEGCKALKKVTGGKNLVKIQKKAFKNCRKLSKVDISSLKLERIENYAFENCSSLKTIRLKSTKLKKVGRQALKGTRAKFAVSIPTNTFFE